MNLSTTSTSPNRQDPYFADGIVRHPPEGYFILPSDERIKDGDMYYTSTSFVLKYRWYPSSDGPNNIKVSFSCDPHNITCYCRPIKGNEEFYFEKMNCIHSYISEGATFPMVLPVPADIEPKNFKYKLPQMNIDQSTPQVPFQPYFAQNWDNVIPPEGYFVLPGHVMIIADVDKYFKSDSLSWISSQICAAVKDAIDVNAHIIAYARPIKGNEGLYNQMVGVKDKGIMNSNMEEAKKPEIDYNKFPNFIVEIRSDTMADIVGYLAEKYGFSCTVLSVRQIIKRGTRIYFPRIQEAHFIAFRLTYNVIPYEVTSGARDWPIYNNEFQLGAIIRHLEAPLPPKEIKVPVVNGYKMEIVHDVNGSGPNFTMVKFGCAYIPMHLFDVINEVNNKNVGPNMQNRKVSSIMLDSGVAINLDQIREIVEYRNLVKNNNK